MLRFTTLANFGMVGALIAPAAFQEVSTVKEMESSLRATDHALRTLESIQEQLQAKDYHGIDSILKATEGPMGGDRERSQLMDQLRREIGELEFQLQELNAPITLPHLKEDPTEVMRNDPETEDAMGTVATIGLSVEQLTEVGNTGPLTPGGDGTELAIRPQADGRYRFEKQGFSADPIRQGRAFYRAAEYSEALRLFEGMAGEVEADYWIGRTLERMGRHQAALTAYMRVISNEDAGTFGERATSEREFLNWIIELDLKIEKYSNSKAIK
jgi:hypothetical protein